MQAEATADVASGGLARFVERHGKVPLTWAGSTSQMKYLNVGDALSPVIVALCASLGVTRIPSSSRTPRMAAVGTIGHGLEGGEVCFWGTGCSPHRNPSALPDAREAYRPPAGTLIRIAATRGPLSEHLLSGGRGGPRVYGDPVWLLPRFYRPTIAKKWKLGVILHLSELTDRDYVAHPDPRHERYRVPASLGRDIRLINTVTRLGVGDLKDRVDEILACERIVSTSLHGMVFAESYGIPCLYFGTGRVPAGLVTADAIPESGIDARIIDLYSGLGLARFDLFNHERSIATDWESVIGAIDRSWTPKPFDADRLLDVFPLPLNPASIPATGSVFDLPLLQELTLQHDVGALRAEDKRRNIA